MDRRLNASRLTGALASLLIVAACSEQSPNPLAPSNPAPAPSFSRESGLAHGLENATVMPTIALARVNAAHRRTGSNNLYYHGGVGGVGVETTPTIYLVLWGSQWNNNDPSGESAILQSFYSHAGGSSWLNSVTQYCQGIATGSSVCGSTGLAGNPMGILAGVWSDNGSAAPSSPTQSQIAAEAVNAAAHFGNTLQGSNATVQYVIATATGNNQQGFAVQWCAYHSSTSSGYGTIAYTNLPYITDGGGSCGAGFNGLGTTAGITIVGGHEMAETISDQFPNGGWLDGSGAENGDKCAWITSGKQGASADVTMNGTTFPVQSLWSNAFNSGAGGCVLSY